MKRLLLVGLFCSHVYGLFAQNSADSVKQEELKKPADDPSQFLTRIEFFNELQHYNRNGNEFYINQTTLRTILRLGKRFTTRIDLPYVYNTINQIGRASCRERV